MYILTGCVATENRANLSFNSLCGLGILLVSENRLNEPFHAESTTNLYFLRIKPDCEIVVY